VAGPPTNALNPIESTKVAFAPSISATYPIIAVNKI
jgi:hypothetical protein